MNAVKINAIVAAASAIVAAVSVLVTLAERMLMLAGLTRDQVAEALADAKKRAATASAKLDAALDADGPQEG